MSPALNGSLVMQCFWARWSDQNIRQNNFQFLHRTITHTTSILDLHVSRVEPLMCTWTPRHMYLATQDFPLWPIRLHHRGPRQPSEGEDEARGHKHLPLAPR